MPSSKFHPTDLLNDLLIKIALILTVQAVRSFECLLVK